MHEKGCGVVAAFHTSLLWGLEQRHWQLVPRGKSRFKEQVPCFLKALEMRRWAKEIKSLNCGYKWKEGGRVEMFSTEVAEKPKCLEMF